MSSSPQLTSLLGRLRAGDDSAREEVIQSSLSRLERIARKMFRQYPRLTLLEQTCDILQSSLIRLDRALRDRVPDSSQHFYSLAAEQIRRVLLDLMKYYSAEVRNQSLGIHADFLPSGDSDLGDPASQILALERWATFHQAVEDLPADAKEVFCLAFYQGNTQKEIGEFLCVDVRTVRRRWRVAVNKLTRALDGELPSW